ncbi:hypothetical protein N9901_02355 [Flavobacteriaceae bacterium]|nr:hypothetical protein [Flavobacteriaceae bacterium]
MKKLLLLTFLAFSTLFISCDKDSDDNTIDTAAIAGTYTGTYSYSISGLLKSLDSEAKQSVPNISISYYTATVTVKADGTLSFVTTELTDTTLEGSISEDGAVNVSGDGLTISGTINAAKTGALTVTKGEQTASLTLIVKTTANAELTVDR